METIPLHARRTGGFPRRLLATGGALVIAGAVVAAQSQAPQPQSPAPREFEVASIRPNTSGGFQVHFENLPKGRFTAINVTLREVLLRYMIPSSRYSVQGGPPWIDSRRFDIVAEADESEGEVKPGQLLEMIRALLEKRFKLVAHKEVKEMIAYALVVGRNPPKLERAKKEGHPVVTMGDHPGLMKFHGESMAGLATFLANVLDTPVVDETGINGIFDFTLDPAQFVIPGGRVTSGLATYLLLTAIEQQLGFKMETRKAPVDVLVIDHAEEPTPN